MSTFSIYHDFETKTTIGKVFEAITNPDHLVNWWPEKCSGKPEKGAIYNFVFTDQYNWYGRVEEIKFNESFHIKMTRSDQDWDPTTFGFDLYEKGDKILVQFRHIDWQDCNAHFCKTSYSWALLLQGLKNYLEQNIIIAFEDRS